VRLEPLACAHVDALCAAAAESRDTYAFTLVPDGSAAMAAYVDTAVAGTARGEFLVFAILDKLRGRVVGSTRFCNFERWDWPGTPASAMPEGPDAVEIGWTWLAARPNARTSTPAPSYSCCATPSRSGACAV
jgi:hypothetical protein